MFAYVEMFSSAVMLFFADFFSNSVHSALLRNKIVINELEKIHEQKQNKSNKST
jgi:hypothetical protein